MAQSGVFFVAFSLTAKKDSEARVAKIAKKFTTRERKRSITSQFTMAGCKN